MIDLEEDCDLIFLSEYNTITNFDCGNADLNDFFCNDAIHYQKQLLGKTYFFRFKASGEIVTAFTLSNDSIKVNDLPNSRSKKVRKDIPSIPPAGFSPGWPSPPGAPGGLPLRRQSPG
jgi:hypothetical protein